MFVRLPRGPAPPKPWALSGDRSPFGEAFAERMWEHVRRNRYEDGILPEGHRDYCGHGLVKQGRGVALCTVYDGMPRIEAPLASWDDEGEFVAFWSRQSNWSVNGFDRNEPLFFTEDEWARANQRLTREAILRVI
ncbi:hypothetical protein [Roseococcus sp. YIM B11640]|uniref:hypothetical protein n=1 Tax=Roseococcus sp. YIM B11640 TaxID=3133973 RepID=UPI003C7D3528